MKSMFHMLHYISIIQLVLKSSTLIIYCASCKWSIHMEPSFSTFLMLFPGYKLQENISYSKEGNALNECRQGNLHKGGNQEPFRKICQGLQPGLRDLRLRRILASSPVRGGTDPVVWRSRPSTKIPIVFSETVAQAGTASIQRTAPGRALEVPSDLEKFGLRSLAGGGTATPAAPKPLQQGFTPTKKRTDVLHPHLLKSSHYLDLGGPTFSHLLFLHRHTALKRQILMAKLCTCTTSSLARLVWSKVVREDEVKRKR